MFSLLLLSLTAIQEPAPDAAPVAVEAAQESEAMLALRKRVDALASAKSYAFRSLTKTENSGMGGARGGFGGGQGRGQRGGETGGQDRPQRGGDAGGQDRPQRGGDAGGQGADRPQGDSAEATAAQEPAEPQPWEGVYQAGKPLLLKRGELHIAKNEQRMAMKSGEAAWATLSMPARGGQGRGQGRGQGGGTGGMDREQMRTMFEVRSIRLPHESMATLLEGIDGEKLVREEKLGLVVFHGPMTEEAALQMAMGGRGMRNRGGRGGQGDGATNEGPIMLGKGMVRIAFAQDGKTMDVKYSAEMAGTFGEREFTASSATEMRVAKIDEASAEIPAAATKALATDPSLEEEF